MQAGKWLVETHTKAPQRCDGLAMLFSGLNPARENLSASVKAVRVPESQEEQRHTSARKHLGLSIRVDGVLYESPRQIRLRAMKKRRSLQVKVKGHAADTVAQLSS